MSPQVHAIFRIGIGQFAPKTKSRGTTLETNPTNGHVGGAAMDGSRQLQQYDGQRKKRGPRGRGPVQKMETDGGSKVVRKGLGCCLDGWIGMWFGLECGLDVGLNCFIGWLDCALCYFSHFCFVESLTTLRNVQAKHCGNERHVVATASGPARLKTRRKKNGSKTSGRVAKSRNIAIEIEQDIDDGAT